MTEQERIEKEAKWLYLHPLVEHGYIAGATAEKERIIKVITNSQGNNHLQWIYDRLIYVYGESPNMDYMIKFKAIIESLKSDSK